MTGSTSDIQTSVIIPSRVDQYLQKTIDDVLAKAEGSLEVIVVLDGYWPNPIIKSDTRVTIIHHGTVHNNPGMRASINAGMSVAQGKYVMKLDEHCMMDQGWDVKLAADCDEDWVVVPRRQRLDAEAWKLTSETQNDDRPPVDYMSIAYPYERQYDRRSGLYGGVWDKQRQYERNDILIDDIMSWQGSCYFLHKAYWDKLIHPLDDVNYGKFNHEAQEIGFKVWLSGGRLVVNKKTWYAHYHKGRRGKGYGFSNEQYRRHEADKEKARRYCMDYWLNNKWPDRKYDFKWLIEKFWPVPGWPENWEEKIKEDAKYDWANDPSKQPTKWLDLGGQKQAGAGQSV